MCLLQEQELSSEPPPLPVLWESHTIMSCKRTALLNLLLFPAIRLQQNPWFFFQLWKYNNLFYSDHTRKQMVLYLLTSRLRLPKDISETEGASVINIAEIYYSFIWPPFIVFDKVSETCTKNTVFFSERCMWYMVSKSHLWFTGYNEYIFHRNQCCSREWVIGLKSQSQ